MNQFQKGKIRFKSVFFYAGTTNADFIPGIVKIGDKVCN